MRVIVIGASGTMGLASVHMLVRAGHEVRAFVRSSATFFRRCAERRLEVVEGDILDRASVAEAMEDADAAIHCVDFPPPQLSLSWDALRHALEGLGPRGQFVYPGNNWVYGPPQTERIGPEHPKYSPARLGALRADLEKAVTAEGGTVVHLPEVYGPGVRRGVLNRIFQRALAGKAVLYPGDLDRPHEFLYVGDAARALIAPLGRPQARGMDFTAPGYASITPRDFISLVFKAAGQPPRIRSLPIGLMRFLLLLQPHGRERRELSYLYECSTLLDGTLIRRDLGWMPEVDYNEGTRRTVKWLRESDDDASEQSVARLAPPGPLQ